VKNHCIDPHYPQQLFLVSFTAVNTMNPGFDFSNLLAKAVPTKVYSDIQTVIKEILPLGNHFLLNDFSIV
jgi:hypothetical protein